MTTREEFIQKIRSKYPQYESIEDDVLYNKIIEKYPSYKDQITNIQPEATDKPIEKSKDTPEIKTPKAGNKPLKIKGIPVRSKPPEALLNLLPILGGVGGAIGGGLVGGGVGSIPGAGLGAGAGEGLKQRYIESQGGGYNPQAVQNMAIAGLLGEGVGSGLGVAGKAAYSKLAPQLGKLAEIDPKRFNNILQMINKGENPFSQRALQGKHPLLRPLIEKDIAEFSKPSLAKANPFDIPAGIGTLIGAAYSPKALGLSLLYGAGRAGVGLAKTPQFHKLGIQGYNVLKNQLPPLGIGGGIGSLGGSGYNYLTEY